MSSSNSSAGPAPSPDALDDGDEVADPVIPGQLPLEANFDDRSEPDQASSQAPDQQEQPPVEPKAPPVLDEIAAAAVELARSAAVETAGPDAVGEHLGVTVEDDGLVLHTFGCRTPGYRGWAWAVTLARPESQPEPTVCEVVLLPQSEAVLAPEWLPWSQRLAPGDLGPGDELPYREDDPNLVPGYTVTDEGDEDQELFWELGLGRERVLGPDGVREAAARWHAGAGGPDTELAIQAASACVSCGYFVPLSGLLRLDFGVCANEWSPSDGRVVTAKHGCGAHSQTDLELPAPEPLPPVILDESLIDEVDVTGFYTDAVEPADAIETVDGSEAFESGLEVEATTLPGAPDVPVPDEPTPGLPDYEPEPGLPDYEPSPGLPDYDPEPGLPDPDPEPVLPGFPQPGIAQPGIAQPGIAQPGIAGGGSAAELEMADAIESSQVESQVESQPES